MSSLASFIVEYWAWPKGARIKTTGRFTITGTSREDVLEACKIRWPEMNITNCQEITAE